MLNFKQSENSHRVRNIFCTLGVIFLGIFFFPFAAFASTTDGTILKPTVNDGYAWGENVGWINLGTTEGNVHVTSSGLTGYMWDSIYGWVNLNPTNAGVKNDGQGNLSGHAWSQNAGYINFSGVTINSSGKFVGYAGTASTTYGRIKFDCANCNVVTDWRPVQPVVNLGGGSTIIIAQQNAPKTPAIPEKTVLPIVKILTPTETVSSVKKEAPSIQAPEKIQEGQTPTQMGGVTGGPSANVIEKKASQQSNLSTIISNAGESIKQGYKQTVTFIQKSITKTKEITNNSFNYIVKKIVTFWEWLFKPSFFKIK